jgi:hypothetical protein
VIRCDGAAAQVCLRLRNLRGIGDRSVGWLQFVRHPGDVDHRVVSDNNVSDNNGSCTAYGCKSSIDAGIRTRALRCCGPQ